jgi:hypothetical protein
LNYAAGDFLGRGQCRTVNLVTCDDATRSVRSDEGDRFECELNTDPDAGAGINLEHLARLATSCRGSGQSDYSIGK